MSIRVLVVDDAIVVRRMLTDILNADPDIEVVGVAANGRIALTKIQHLKPDVVILDIEMPEMDGLETLAAIQTDYRKLPVIMFSTVTKRGAAQTIKALSLGARDYVAKPSNTGTVTASIDRVRAELIPKVKYFGRDRVKSIVPHTVQAPAVPRRSGSGAPIEIVAIGSSTGGPNALAEIIPVFPAGLGVPLVIVQHMPPFFTTLLADRLNKHASLDVVEAAAGMVLRPGGAWVAPGDYHMHLERADGGVRIGTTQDPPEHSCRPAVDVLFRSVAALYGGAALAVVMTGMGQDGLAGCEAIRAAGGQVVVQDQASSVVWGMPGLVAQAGLADAVVPLADLGAEIVRRVQAHAAVSARPQAADGGDARP